MKLKPILRATCAAAALVVMAAAAHARDVKIVVGVPPGSGAHFGVDAFAGDLAARTNGGLKVRVLPASLLNLVQTFGGMKDGVVDGGYLVLNYFETTEEE